MGVSEASGSVKLSQATSSSGASIAAAMTATSELLGEADEDELNAKRLSAKELDDQFASIMNTTVPEVQMKIRIQQAHPSPDVAVTGSGMSNIGGAKSAEGSFIQELLDRQENEKVWEERVAELEAQGSQQDRKTEMGKNISRVRAKVQAMVALQNRFLDAEMLQDTSGESEQSFRSFLA